MNVSSGGILFTVEGEIPVGVNIEVIVSWPAMLASDPRMRLVALGRVVRVASGTAAMTISRYEFRH